MALPNIFTKPVADGVIGRINMLTPQTKPLWGKMSVSQMMAHCNVSYEMVYEAEKHSKPNGFMKFILKLLVKEKVVGEAPYKHNERTAPAFIIADQQDFETEKARLIGYVLKTQEMGEGEFNNHMSHSFGPLSITEWNNLFYKHIDHHLMQFGV